MKFYDICTKRTYEKDGEQKAAWFNVGKLKVTDDGKQFIDLNMFPNTPFYVFEQKDKDHDAQPKPKPKLWTADEISWGDQP